MAETQTADLGLRSFEVAAPLPEIAVRQLWHARVDSDPAQRWLRETIRAAVH